MTNIETCTELCPYCEEEAELEYRFEKQQCTHCKKEICAMLFSKM